MTELEKSTRAFKKLNEKLRNLEGGCDLIHAEYDMTHMTAYPAYGFACGVEENRLEHVENFAKALKKAVTLCKNFKYNGRRCVY